MAKLRVLIAEPENSLAHELEKKIGMWGYSVRAVDSSQALEKALQAFSPDIVMIRRQFSGWPPGRLIEEAGSGLQKRRSVVVLTEEDHIDDAVETVKAGAADYVVLPVDWDPLRDQLERVGKEIELRQSVARLASKLGPQTLFGPFVGASKAMREVYDLVKVLAANDTSVLITGESGTGKELVAQTIHKMSARSEGPLITINCAAFPRDLIESQIFGHVKGAFTGANESRAGCFEMADGGILFLDEIAEMPTSLQPKLLRVLETGRVRRLGGKKEKSFDVRLLAATNRPVKKVLKEGRLREDLFFRINVFNVHLPPLRRRKGDIALLAQFFVQGFNRKHGFQVEGLDGDTLRRLKHHDWPGNVRELKNVVERAVVMTRRGFIQPSQLPPALRGALSSGRDESEDAAVIPVGTTLADAEKEVLRKTLAKTGGNKSETARILQVDVKTVRSKIKKYGL
ncbi:MAG TPA: sigma-54 dependent transcriptional regulator [Acidobacteriota bacterium]|nr:sigma-54 dependent transcriptional regulator [Acidobacteriota bacterium]